MLCCNKLQPVRKFWSLAQPKERLVHTQWLPMTARVPNRVLPVPETSLGQPFPRLLQIAAFVIALSVLPALAKTHPVPLGPKVDSAKCLECHADKTKGKAIHSAIATGCLSCHEVRVAKDVTRVKLITTTPYKLCLSCHSDKDATQIKGTVHKPAVRDCLTCHDSHVSDFKNQLLKATTGDKKDNLCLSCHNEGVDVPAKGSRHAALDMGCDTCHTTHKTGADLTAENRFHLTKAAPALCVDCHDPKDEALAKAHQNQPFDKANCLQCHDPHQSAAAKLMAKFQHPPFADKQCDTCHAPAKDGKVVLTQANVKDLCVTCHSDKAEQIEKAKIQHPGAAGDCTDCHNPHAGNSPGFVQPDPVAACLTCHSDQAGQGKKAHLHQPAFVQGCATCHEPHGGDNEHLLRRAGVNVLCLECHGPDVEPKKLESEHLVAIFDGKVRLPENYFNRVPLLPLKYDMGHPTEHHPVSDVTNAKTNISMNCLTCHQPHSGKEEGMLVKDQRNDMAFCKTCHANGLDLSDVKIGGK